MAKQLATYELVSDTAGALMSEGVDPTILSVKARLGVGSYSTIQRNLDDWKQRNLAYMATTPLPRDIEERGQQLLKTVWSLASKHIDVGIEQGKVAAQNEVAALRKDLTEARNEIVRLEASEGQLRTEMCKLTSDLKSGEHTFLELKTEALRIPELESELTHARSQCTELTFRLGALTGEVDALRLGLRELTAAIHRSPD